MQPTNLTSSIQVTSEMIEAGRSAFRYGHLVPVEAIYLAMRSKDHSIAVDDVRVLTALLDYSDGAFIPMEPAVRQAITAAITAIGSQSIEGERG